MSTLLRRRRWSSRLSTFILLLGLVAPSLAHLSPAGTVTATTPIELWRDGEQVGTYSTIQAAIDAALAGDTVRLRAGTYHETIEITTPIILEGAAGEPVTLDGAHPELQVPGNGRWTHIGNGIYTADVPYADPYPSNTWVTYTTDDKMIYPYLNEERFQEFDNGEGSTRDNQTITVKLEDNLDPNTIGLNVSAFSYIIRVRANCMIRNLTVKNAVNIAIGLVGESLSSVVIDNVEIVSSKRGVASTTGDASGIQISHSTIRNGWQGNWAWRSAYQGGLKDIQMPIRGHGIYITGATDSEIHHNRIHGVWDGMKVAGTNIIIHDNQIHNVNDDAIELEGTSENLHFYNNTLWDYHVGISMLPNVPGPLYVYRNVAVNNKVIRWELEPGSTNGGYVLKMGVGQLFSNAKIYNNSFYSHGVVLFDRNQAMWADIEFVNNVMYSTYERADDEMSRSKGSENIGRPNEAIWDYNLWVKTTVRDDDNAIRNDVNGVLGEPLYVDPLAGPPDLCVTAASPVIDAGVDVARTKGWPDSLVPSDGHYDIGALEHGDCEQNGGTISPQGSIGARRILP